MKPTKTATKGKSAPGMAKYAAPPAPKATAKTGVRAQAPAARESVRVAPSKKPSPRAATQQVSKAVPAPAKKTGAKVKKERVKIWSPRGRFSYPNLAFPDTGRTYSDDAYKTDLFILKPEWKEFGGTLKEAVLQVGRDAFGTKFAFGKEWHTPFKDTDKDEKIVDETQKNCILIRAKSKPAKTGKRVGVARQPVIFGPAKDAKGNFPILSQEEVEEIKGGDWGRIYCDVFAYDQSGGGVTFGLSAVQFWKEGDPFGQGLARLLETVEELESEELEEVEEEGPADDEGDEPDGDEDGDDDGEEEVEEDEDF